MDKQALVQLLNKKAADYFIKAGAPTLGFGDQEAGIGVIVDRTDSFATLTVISNKGAVDLAYTAVYANRGYPVGDGIMQVSSSGDLSRWWVKIPGMPADGEVNFFFRPEELDFQSCLKDAGRFVYYANRALHHKYVIIDRHLDSNPAYVGDEHVGVSTYHGAGGSSFAQQLRAKLISSPNRPKKLVIRALNDEDVVIGEVMEDGSGPDYYYVIVNPLASGKIYFQLSVT